jgi:hypothetical protein
MNYSTKREGLMIESTQPNRQTRFIPGEGLQIPVFDLSLNDQGGYLSEPETKRNSMLELLFQPEELASLTIVKPNPNDTRFDPLKSLQFEDGIPRMVAFSSGNSIYFADKRLARKLNAPFKTQRDHACRYGSLLVSSCNEGAVVLDSSDDNQPLRVKVVDFETTPEIATQFRTGDCHGKISPRLAMLVGGESNRPFQFRLAWMKQWGRGMETVPQASFLAKGTFLPDSSVTEKQGYDLVLDRSSIKGIVKHQLDELVPCGDYELPKAILGNRGNAKAQEYENSWQLSIWYSQTAIEKDIVPPTQVEATKLAEIQKDPLKLAQYLIQRHDQKAQFRQQEEDNLGIEDESESEQQSESRLIALLRHDTYGQLLDFPKVADFMRSQLANRWRDLAIKGAIRHGSAMAQPCDDLKPGTMVVPHLTDGEEVIVTRYPIVSKDNIRRYTIDNQQKPALQRYRGCAFIRSDQAMTHHQCDFDGDQLVITPAHQIPHIAAETRHANEEREYKAVAKRDKIDYSQATNTRGKQKYTKLRQIAIAVPQNSIGYVATLIGRVQSSVPQANEPQKRFQRRKRQLLGKLFDALQIEVDSPKSATRFDEVYPKLVKQAKAWTEKHPSHLFDFKRDERLYKTMPLPTQGDNPINAIARDAVNPQWTPTRIRSRHRHEFRYLFPSQDLASEDYLDWAKELKERASQAGQEIHQLHGGDSQAIKEAYSKLYDNLRGEIVETFPDEEERQEAATALWHLETTNPNLNVPRKECAKLARKLQITFELVEGYERQHEAIPKDTYILSVPFVDRKGRDLGSEYKAALNRKGIDFEATIHPTLPMVQFALLNPSEKLVRKLEAQFGENDNFHIKSSDLTYHNPHLNKTSRISDRIVPPTHYNWLENSEDITPKSALVLNLFTDEIIERLQNFQYDQVELIGQKYNDFKGVDFGQSKWRGKSFTFAVEPYDNPDDYRHGSPIVTLKGKQLAMFSVESAKLPIGTTFKATIAPAKGSALALTIQPNSIQLPMLSEGEKSEELESQVDEVSEVLQGLIAEKYQNTGQAKVKVGEWTAFINGKTQDCFVRDQARQVVFGANLTSHEITQPLSTSHQQQFSEMMAAEAGVPKRTPQYRSRVVNLSRRQEAQV